MDDQEHKPSLWDFNQRAKAERDRDERYNEALAAQVSRWAIQGYATLTFNTPRSVESALHAAKGWLRGIQSLGPGSDLFALLAPEQGTAGNLVHIEVVLGGLLPRRIPVSHRVSELQWILHKAAQRWVGDPAGFSTAEARLSGARRARTHGRITVEKPKSRRDVAVYVTKQCHHGEWEIVGRPFKRRNRKQKHKRNRSGNVRAVVQEGSRH